MSVKAIASLVSVVILSELTLSGFSEATVWQDRRHHRSHQDFQRSEAQLASLPLPLQQSFPLQSYSPSLFSFRNSLVPHQETPVQRQAAAVVSDLLSNDGSIRKISYPAHWDGTTLIHVQDIHLNAEAQRHIAQMVSRLLERNKLDLVALEGIWTSVNMDPYHKFADRAALQTAADYLLRENKISGAVYAGLFGKGDPPLYAGVDDPIHYLANVEAYKHSLPLKTSIKQQLNGRVKRLDERKRNLFSGPLAEFDRKRQEYRSGSLSLGSYLQTLAGYAPPASNTRLFLEAWDQESRLAVPAVERERNRLLSKLAGTLNQDQTTALLQLSIAYRLQQISHTDFYESLHQLCRQHQINLSDYPAMDSYIQYLMKTDRLDPEALFADIHRLESLAIKKLALTRGQQDLLAESDYLYLAGRLADFSLTTQEWQNYHSLQPADPMDLHSFESFYREAEKRDGLMAENLLKTIHDNKASVSLLVTGGFHSVGIQNELTRNGSLVITYVPRITKPEGKDSTSYLSVFSQKKTPLEKLVEGSRLFVAPNPAQLSLVPFAAAAAAENSNPTSPLSPQTRLALEELGLPANAESHDLSPVQTRLDLPNGSIITTFDKEKSASIQDIKVQVRPWARLRLLFTGLVRKFHQAKRWIVLAVAATLLSTPSSVQGQINTGIGEMTPEETTMMHQILQIAGEHLGFRAMSLSSSDLDKSLGKMDPQKFLWFIGQKNTDRLFKPHGITVEIYTSFQKVEILTAIHPEAFEDPAHLLKDVMVEIEMEIAISEFNRTAYDNAATQNEREIAAAERALKTLTTMVENPRFLNHYPLIADKLKSTYIPELESDIVKMKSKAPAPPNPILVKRMPSTLTQPDNTKPVSLDPPDFGSPEMRKFLLRNLGIMGVLLALAIYRRNRIHSEKKKPISDEELLRIVDQLKLERELSSVSPVDLKEGIEKEEKIKPRVIDPWLTTIALVGTIVYFLGKYFVTDTAWDPDLRPPYYLSPWTWALGAGVLIYFLKLLWESADGGPSPEEIQKSIHKSADSTGGSWSSHPTWIKWAWLIETPSAFLTAGGLVLILYFATPAGHWSALGWLLAPLMFWAGHVFKNPKALYSSPVLFLTFSKLTVAGVGILFSFTDKYWLIGQSTLLILIAQNIYLHWRIQKRALVIAELTKRKDKLLSEAYPVGPAVTSSKTLTQALHQYDDPKHPLNIRLPAWFYEFVEELSDLNGWIPAYEVGRIHARYKSVLSYTLETPPAVQLFFNDINAHNGINAGEIPKLVKELESYPMSSTVQSLLSQWKYAYGSGLFPENDPIMLAGLIALMERSEFWTTPSPFDHLLYFLLYHPDFSTQLARHAPTFEQAKPGSSIQLFKIIETANQIKSIKADVDDLPAGAIVDLVLQKPWKNHDVEIVDVVLGNHPDFVTPSPRRFRKFGQSEIERVKNILMKDRSDVPLVMEDVSEWIFLLQKGRHIGDRSEEIAKLLWLVTPYDEAPKPVLDMVREIIFLDPELREFMGYGPLFQKADPNGVENLATLDMIGRHIDEAEESLHAIMPGTTFRLTDLTDQFQIDPSAAEVIIRHSSGFSPMGEGIYKKTTQSRFRRASELFSFIFAILFLGIFSTESFGQTTTHILAPLLPSLSIQENSIPQPAISPDMVKTVRTEDGIWLNVKGETWSGAPGFSYQPVPNGEIINAYERGRLAYLYKALLPPNGEGLDPNKYSDLIQLAKNRDGAAAQNHARLLSEAGAKVIRTYNLSASTEDDLKKVNRIFQWLYETHGVMFIAGMYEPSEAAVHRTAEIFKNNPGLLYYDGWNEIDMRGATAEKYQDIDRLAGILKKTDDHHPVALVISRLASQKDLDSIKAMKNIDIVSMTIYDLDGPTTAGLVNGMQKELAPKVVTIGEVGVKIGEDPAERARRVSNLAESLTRTNAASLAPAPVVIWFEFTPESWKRIHNDNDWWFIDGNNNPTTAYQAAAEVNKKWVSGPIQHGRPEEQKKMTLDLVPEGTSGFLNEQYGGEDYFGRFGRISEEQSIRILKGDALRLIIDAEVSLRGIHIDLKGREGNKLPVYDLFITKEPGTTNWKTFNNESNAVITEATQQNRLIVTVDIPAVDIQSVIDASKGAQITEIHVQTGKQQKNVPLNNANVESSTQWKVMNKAPQEHGRATPREDLSRLAHAIVSAVNEPEENIAPLIPIGPVGVNALTGSSPVHGFPSLSEEDQSRVITLVWQTFAQKNRRRINFMQARRRILKLHGYRFTPIHKLIGDSNIGLDLNINTLGEIPAALSTIHRVMAQMSRESLLILPASPNQVVQTAWETELRSSQPGRIIFIKRTHGDFFNENEDGRPVFNVEAFLKGIESTGLTNVTITTQGEFILDPAVREEYERRGILINVVLIVEWLNGILGFAVNKKMPLNDLDKLARAIATAA